MERRRFVVEPSWKEKEQRRDPNSTFKMFWGFFPTMPFFSPPCVLNSELSLNTGCSLEPHAQKITSPPKYEDTIFRLRCWQDYHLFLRFCTQWPNSSSKTLKEKKKKKEKQAGSVDSFVINILIWTMRCKIRQKIQDKRVRLITRITVAVRISHSVNKTYLFPTW